jgi:Flp pilus assembly protein TadG
MLAPLIQRPHRSAPHRKRERGVTMALVALSIVGMLAMAALSIDIGTLYEASAEAQRAADAGALAAARVISMSGITGDTTATTGWAAVCGGSGSLASLAAINVAQQNLVGGAQVASSNINVYYGTSSGVGTDTDCSALTTAATTAFAVNPVVEVSVQQPKLPTFFARVFALIPNGTFSNSGVTATAAAEAFNPSGEGGTIPVQPRCVKPWMVPNYEPWIPSNYSCNTNNCTPFVDKTTGAIQSQGNISKNANAVIGQTFWLTPDCRHNGTNCTLRTSPNPPQANFPPTGNGNNRVPPLPSLDYLPGQALYASTAVPSDGTDACRAVSDAGYYAQAIAGCDQTTQYQCGQSGQNVVDLSENPGRGDTTNGAQCLTHQAAGTSDALSAGTSALGQDIMQPPFNPPPTYPFQIQPGSNSPLLNAGAKSTDLISSSTSIVSLPIYDSSAQLTFTAGNTTQVTVIGFLQVFINFVDGNGNLNVTVMNVAGCGNAIGIGTQALNGTSPVPIRLITQPAATSQ